MPEFYRRFPSATAGVLTEMDAELAGMEQRRGNACALKQGLMQELPPIIYR